MLQKVGVERDKFGDSTGTSASLQECQNESDRRDILKSAVGGAGPVGARGFGQRRMRRR